MRTSKAGIELIKSFEGFQPISTPIGNGRWVIGYGHVKAARKGLRISRADAESVLFEYDLPPIEDAIRRRVLAPIHQNEFDALVSFVFSIGVPAFERSDVLAYLNAGDFLRAAEAMGAWRRAYIGDRSVIVDALVRRRAAERALFLEHPGGRTAVVSASLRVEPDPVWLRSGSEAEADATDQQNVAVADPTEETPGEEEEDGNGPQMAAKAVAERLTRILGETQPSELEPVYLDTPSEDEIRRAVSALSGEGESEPDVQDGEDEFPSVERVLETRSSTRIVDDLEPLTIPPPSPTIFEPASTAPPASWAPYAMFSGFGAILSVWGVFRAHEAATQAAANQGVLAGVVGAFLFFVMAYYAVRALSDES